jgi:hypothetical protein
MAVRCSRCGEELLGPVNRCWKCGQVFAMLPDDGGLPPVRRDVPAVAARVAAPAAEAVAPTGQDKSRAGEGTTAVRTGSPFAAGAMMTAAAASDEAAGRRQQRVGAPQVRIGDDVAVAGAISSILMGIIALSIAWISNPVSVVGAIVLAMLGLALGVWGLFSRRRGWALFGMIVCVIAFSIASFTGAMLIYEAQREAEETAPALVEDEYGN